MRVFLREKPSQGRDIAHVLGASQRGAGCYSGAGIVMTWRIGHLVETVPPESYGEQCKRWAIEQLPIISERWRVEPKAATAAGSDLGSHTGRGSRGRFILCREQARGQRYDRHYASRAS